MARRKRKHISMSEKLASALADKLPADLRNELRERRVPAKQIIRMFTPDHVKLHCWGGSDKWFNLDMRARDATLKAKDGADTSRAAKVVRIRDRDKIVDAGRRLLSAPKKKLQSRGFQKPPEGYRYSFGRRPG